MTTSVNFSFARDWFAEWRECYRPITKRSTVLQNQQNLGYFDKVLLRLFSELVISSILTLHPKGIVQR